MAPHSCPAGYQYLQPRLARAGCYRTCIAPRADAVAVTVVVRLVRRTVLVRGPLALAGWTWEACSGLVHRAQLPPSPSSPCLPPTLPATAEVLRRLPQRHPCQPHAARPVRLCPAAVPHKRARLRQPRVCGCHHRHLCAQRAAGGGAHLRLRWVPVACGGGWCDGVAAGQVPPLVPVHSTPTHPPVGRACRLGSVHGAGRAPLLQVCARRHRASAARRHTDLPV